MRSVIVCPLVHATFRCSPKLSVRRGIVYLKRVGFCRSVFYRIATQLEVDGMRERALVSRVSSLSYKFISAFAFIYSDDSCSPHA